MSHRARNLVLAALVAVGSTAIALVTTTNAVADTQICEQFGSTTIGGKYVVQNNRWGSSATQCINVTSTGFSIIQQDGTGNTSGAPVSYPSIYVGCHYSNCSPGTNLPAQISKISSAPTSISNSYPSSGTYDAAYDIWLNADTNVSGVQDTEIMVWLHHTGSIQPIGSTTGQAAIAGRTWAVWTGNNGQNNVVSYVQSGIGSLSFDVMDFVRDTLNRGSQYGNTSWYLTSIQAGFEPWIGGVGLAVNTFSASVNTGTTTSPPPSSSPQPSTSPTGQSGSCSATYRTVNPWQGGFQGEVTVHNNGSSTLNGWTVRGSLPSGVTFSNLWNGVLTTSGTTFAVKNVDYNGSLAGNASTTFGFTANGSAPGSWPLTCTSP